MWVADYSSSRPDLAALKAAGCSGIIRYALDVAGTTFHKAVDKIEIDTALALGLTVTIVQESVAQPALGGFAAGANEAQAANARMDTLGYPGDCWIYYAAEDPNILPQSSWPVVADYFRGVASVNRRPAGGYGSKPLLDYLAGLGLITRKWAVDPWGGHTGCDLAQYAAPVPAQFSADVDGNLVISADYGQCPRPGPPPSPKPLWKDDQMAVFQYTDGMEHIAYVDPSGNLIHKFVGSTGAFATETRATGCIPGAPVGVDTNFNGQLHLYAPRPDGKIQHCFWNAHMWASEIV